MEQERKRSIALQEVSRKVTAAHDTDEVLGLIVNESVRLVGASSAGQWLLDGEALVPSASTEAFSNVPTRERVTFVNEAGTSIDRTQCYARISRWPNCGGVAQRESTCFACLLP